MRLRRGSADELIPYLIVVAMVLGVAAVVYFFPPRSETPEEARKRIEAIASPSSEKRIADFKAQELRLLLREEFERAIRLSRQTESK